MSEFSLRSTGENQQLEELKRFTTEINGNLGQVSVVNQPALIERALAEAEAAIDAKAALYRDNPLVRKLAEQMKAQVRRKILRRAAGAE